MGGKSNMGNWSMEKALCYILFTSDQKSKYFLKVSK